MARLMCQPRRSDDIADGVDARFAGRQPLIDNNVAAVDLNLGAFQPDVLDIAGDADGQHDPVDGLLLLLAV